MTLEQRAALPAIARLGAWLLERFNRLLDWFYHSEYNPLYRSGTLIVGLFFVLLVTGLYLLLFYDVAAPYQSVARIEGQVLLGSWMRAVHRYATDAAVLVLLYHTFQMFVQGRTWGPRLLAWLSGIVLLGALLFSAWTGYVMIWDEHGQLLAIAGSEMLQVFPFLRATIGHAFDGTTPVLSSFFFMNLFLHVAIPLGMVAGIWIHTAKLARTAWFPRRKIFLGAFAALAVAALLWPAPLLERADLFAMVGRIKVDWLFAFWVPLVNSFSPAAALVFWVALAILGLSVPWWLRPVDHAPFVPSYVDKEACLGCRQCSRDCPYEAISMEPRPGKVPLYSLVHADKCVSCGLCSASCDDFAIGPAGRTAKIGMERLTDLLRAAPEQSAADSVFAFVCECNGDAISRLRAGDGLSVSPIECCGTLHAHMIEAALERFRGVAIWGCPERNCANRDGVALLRQRVFEFRHPTLGRKIDRRRILLLPLAAWESAELQQRLQRFKEALSVLEQDQTAAPAANPRVGKFYPLKRAAASLLLVFGAAAFSHVPLGTDPQDGLLRTAFHVPGAVNQKCRPLTAEEIANLPVHMQRKEVCEQRGIEYQLRIYVDGALRLERAYTAAGARGDRAVFVLENIELRPGESLVRVVFEPEEEELREAYGAQFEESVRIERGRIALVTYDPSARRLYLKSPA